MAMMETEGPVIPVQSFIPIVGLKPPLIDRNGREMGGNILEKLPELRNEIKQKLWIRELFKDVLKKRSTAVVTIIAGGLIITASLGVFELGIKHGQDIKEFSKIFRRKTS